jgi:alkanesulfonate monooxygenase SsuD/methylene tetrahydromethanopterin reductase-like flavin-dependent oxidoreductase (luciferase family)
MVEHHGEFYDLPPLRMTPPPPSPIPVWIGGQSEAAMARVLRNDGWIGNAYTLEEAVRRVEHVRKAREESGGSLDGFEIICAIYALDIDSYKRLEEAGATGVLTAPWMIASEPTVGGRLDAVRAFGDQVIGPMSEGG